MEKLMEERKNGMVENRSNQKGIIITIIVANYSLFSNLPVDHSTNKQLKPIPLIEELNKL